MSGLPSDGPLLTIYHYDTASSSKAGLAVDQDEINRKIYEASKGSKFFENEKKSDERTTKQIDALLARRDAILRQIPRGSDAWIATERRVDEQVSSSTAYFLHPKTLTNRS